MSWYSAVCALETLRHVLACSYTATSTPPRRLVPDACIDVVAISDGGLWVCGPERTGWDFELPHGWRSIGVRFRPGAAPAVLGVSAAMLADRRWRLRDVLGVDVERRLAVHLCVLPFAANHMTPSVDEVAGVSNSFLVHLVCRHINSADALNAPGTLPRQSTTAR